MLDIVVKILRVPKLRTEISITATSLQASFCSKYSLTNLPKTQISFAVPQQTTVQSA